MESWARSDQINARVRCLIAVKASCTNLSPQFYEKILKKAYLIFFAESSRMTWATYDLNAFMINGLVINKIKKNR